MNLSFQITRNKGLGYIRLEILSNVFIGVQWSVNMQISVKFDYFLVERKPWSINFKHKHQPFQTLCFSELRTHDYCLQETILFFFLPDFCITKFCFKNKIKAHFVYEFENGWDKFHYFKRKCKAQRSWH